MKHKATSTLQHNQIYEYDTKEYMDKHYRYQEQVKNIYHKEKVDVVSTFKEEKVC